MILNPFAYTAPETLQEAISLLTETGFEVFTGDQSYIGSTKKGITKPSSLVSLRNIPGLKSIIFYGNQLEIGSGVTFDTMLNDSAISSVPVLTEALKAIKDPHLRNHSNVGGALHHNGPAHAPVLAAFLALDGKISVSGPLGDRQILLETYFSNEASGGLTKGEIIKSIVLTTNSLASGSFHFIDYLKAGKLVCGVAVLVNKDQNVITGIRIAASGCVTIPARLRIVEDALAGKEINKENIDAALRGLLPEGLSISSQFISNPSYLLHLLKVLIKRAVLKS